MKRGDYAALLLFVLLAGLAFWYSRGLETVIPALGDLYFQVPLSPLSEALSSIRTLGYPLFHAFMASHGQGPTAYPEAQMLVLIPCVLIFGLGLRAYGLTSLAALAAAAPLLWIVPVEQVIPETLAKCFAVAAAGFLLWAAGTRKTLPYIGLAIAVFVACQMRPAFLFLVAWAPVAWLFLYTRRWGILNQAKWIRHAFGTGLACTIPLVLFCLLRLVVVGHFGLVSFGGQNTIGISIEMLDSKTVAMLPPEDRPLARILSRGREAWPAPRFVTARGTGENWIQNAETYAANVNRTGRALQAKFPMADGERGNVALDKALSSLSIHTFQVNWPLYRTWLVGAGAESLRMALYLLLGGGGNEGFGPGPGQALAVVIGLITLVLLSWPLERRAFGEGSRPHFSRAVTVLFFLSGTFFLAKMLLVILVEPPIARYVEAAAFLLPCTATALAWDRSVVLAAAICKRPHWYNQCYAAYPPIPDIPHPLPWRAWANSLPFSRRIFAASGAVLVVLAATAIWTTEDNRLFRRLERHPDRVREGLMRSNPPVTWRAKDNATLLHVASLHGDRELAQHVIEAGAETGATTRDGATALHWAAMGDKGAGAIPTLLSAGLDVNAPGPLGLSPLHLAALFGNVSAVEALSAAHANPNPATTTGVTPLHLADSRATAEALLKGGATLDAPDGTGATPFMWAHTHDLARYFLERGANINARENWRSFVRECTPLTKAAYQGDNETARWLLEHGADPNAGDINNLTPVYYAIWRRNIPLLQLLLDHGADPNHPGQWTEYNRDKTSFRYTDIFGKTVGRRFERDTYARLVPDSALMHPLDWAAFLGNAAAIEALHDRGAKLDNHNEEGMSALHWALLGRQEGAEKLLRSFDSQPSLLDDPKLPVEPFRASVQEGHRDLATKSAPAATPAGNTSESVNTNPPVPHQP